MDGELFDINNERAFEKVVRDTFHYQAEHIPVYKEYLSLLNVDVTSISKPQDIPFLPIDVFKTHSVVTDAHHTDSLLFTSSGTTGMVPSKHWVSDPNLYRSSFTNCFQRFYGDPKSFAILALLPNYLEREHSSLVYMVQELMEQSGHPVNNFYLYDHTALANVLTELEESGQQTLLIGVSFALLDFAEKHPMPLRHTTIMETGGMKGMRKEMIRSELHQLLSSAFHPAEIHSDYGMTELLSQAYADSSMRFRCPPWMRMYIRDTADPFTWLPTGQTGGISIIDLANRHSCSFIATQDLGKLYPDGSFEVSGRFDNADIRGCNLLVQ